MQNRITASCSKAIHMTSAEKLNGAGAKLGISFFVIATKNYLEFAETLIRSAAKYAQPESPIRFVLLTDDIDRAAQLLRGVNDFEIKFKSIPSLGWPDATLRRYEIMLSAWPLVAHDLVAYIDADMEFVRRFSVLDLVEPLTSTAEIILVHHPGYFNRHPIYRFLLKTALGPWEHRKASAAYVPRQFRITYVCGGMFWGRALAFHELLQQLSLSVKSDSEGSFRAKHNDESHLNRWFTEQTERCVVEPPRWAFDATYRHLSGITPIVAAVRKPKTFKRVLN